MSHYGYLPHEYSYDISLADHYDLYPWDSMIHNMVSERYPRLGMKIDLSKKSYIEKAP